MKRGWRKVRRTYKPEKQQLHNHIEYNKTHEQLNEQTNKQTNKQRIQTNKHLGAFLVFGCPPLSSPKHLNSL